MPFQSEQQRKFMFSQLPEIAKRWEAETPKGKKLPKYKHKESSKLHEYLKKNKS